MNLQVLREHAGRLLTSGKHEKAANCYRELLKSEPRDPELHLRHAEACLGADRLHDALGSLGAAATLLAEAGNLASARATLKQALELQPVPAHPEVRSALWKLEGIPEAAPAPAADPVSQLALWPDRVEFSRDLPSAPATPAGPEMLRVDDRTLAIRQADGWLLVSSAAPLQLGRISEAELQAVVAVRQGRAERPKSEPPPSHVGTA